MKRPLTLSMVLLAGTCLSTAPVWSAQTRTNQTDQIQNGPADTGSNSSSQSGSRSSSGTGSSGSSSGMSSSGSGMSGSGMSGSGSSDTGASSSGSSRRSARSGRSQTNVRAAQEALRDKGFDPGPVDGIMGPRTQQALRSFQQSNNLQATGRLDSQTSQQLNASIGGSSSGMGGSSSGSMGSSTTGRSGSSGLG